ncbi:FAD-dependent oxidoreductase [Robertmurraya andreesenii]|uniref:Ferredoxin-NADP reductase n=1 Tax=Anoxybacillus andreesenii TaxID=1325932 RepID=A0ABT9V973_9BACL|nr:FAD-dependent oxidoreductase [Robertmurraya andreesenii]MDQ0157509.1 ferredoxin-NADP reductase [Robertmurraya andreesenii]
MGIIQDISRILKKRELKFIESYKESEEIHSFIFEKEKDLNWKAGQHGVFSILHKKIQKPTRPFSVASAPEENIVKITMVISEHPSEFKKAMLELSPGMKISMRGPIGPLYLDDKSPSLLIAGGIGVTPFRSILKQIEMVKGGIRNPITLLYMDSNKSYIYKNELDEMAKNPSIMINYLDSRDRLYQEIDRFTTMHKESGIYCIAGTKAMVDSVSVYLKGHGIPKRNIKKDVFMGYK